MMRRRQRRGGDDEETEEEEKGVFGKTRRGCSQNEYLLAGGEYEGGEEEGSEGGRWQGREMSLRGEGGSAVWRTSISSLGDLLL